MTKKTTAAAKTTATPKTTETATAVATSTAPAATSETAADADYIPSSHITHAKIDTITAAGDIPGGDVSTGGVVTFSANVLIRPTVGRKVWYRPGPQDRHSHMQWIEGEPLDATILAVHGDRSINAQVLDINGTPFIRRNWPLVQQGDDIPEGSYFEWMPYQTGQAAKAA
jgi:hypothetical protein